MGRRWPMSRLPRPSTVACRRVRISASVWSPKALNWRWKARNAGDPPTPRKLDGEAGSEADCDAVGQAAGGLRPLDAATAGRRTGGVGSGRFDQSRDGPQDAKKNGMTKRKIEYWVIPPEQTPSSWPAWKKCWKPTRRPYDPSIRCCAWTSNRCSCSRRRGCRSLRRRSIGKRVDYEYERNGTASIFMFAEPLSGFRQATARVTADQGRLGDRSAPSCWTRATPIASR